MIPYLPPHCPFPDPRDAIAHHDGLVCVTDQLTPEHILAAYPCGIFPWFNDADFFYWFSVAPRAVLLPDKLHLSRSLKKSIQTKSYKITVNHDFAQVIGECAAQIRPNQDGTWIAPEFQQAYHQVHQMGHAHSFEYWDDKGQLMGGLYGVQVGRVFFGESMFAHQSDASKIAFAHAVPFLEQAGVQLIDCQQDTEHLRRFGSQLMDFEDFQAALNILTTQSLNYPIQKAILFDNTMK